MIADPKHYVLACLLFLAACTGSDGEKEEAVQGPPEEPTFTCKGGGYGVDVYNHGGNLFSGALDNPVKALLFTPQLMGKKEIKLVSNQGSNKDNNHVHKDIQKKLDFTVWGKAKPKGKGFYLTHVSIVIYDQIGKKATTYTVKCPK